MSYQVIARKWRPQNFSQLIGQDHVSQTLINALKNNRLPHALLFTGVRGTGKTSSARILAKALRCPNVKDFIPCNTCDDCQDIANGRSPNVSEIDGASNNGVDAIRELLDNVAYMPSTGKYKLYIIDEVHMLTTSAFNALLKTLEEPPEHVIFVLATTEVHKIPNTILSRCQRFDFRRISTKQIAESLEHICKTESIETEEEALWMIARQGDGSLRDSQSLLDQVITFCEGHLTLEKVISVLGLTDRGLIVDSIQALVNRNTQDMLRIASNIVNAGSDPKIFVQDLLEEIRNLLMIKLSPDHAHAFVDIPGSEIARLKDLGASLSEEDIHLLFDMALKGANDIPRAQDPKVVLEMLLLRMSAAPRIISLAELGSDRPVAANTPAVASLGAGLGADVGVGTSAGAGVAATAPAPVPANLVPANTNGAAKTPKPTKNTTTPDTFEAKWSDLVEKIKKVNGVIAAKLEHSYLVDIKDNKVTVGIPAKMKFLAEQVNDKDFKVKLQNYMRTFWGADYTMEVQPSTGSSQATTPEKPVRRTPKTVERQMADEEKRRAREEVEDHPAVRAANEVFKTRIVAIEEQK